jgi:methionyl-tRNA formyltransferase
MRVVFCGNPEFALPSLEAIVGASYEVPAVITSPDRPQGRGLKLKAPAVKQKALELGLRVLQPSKLKEQGFLTEVKSLNAEILVVVAFRILPPELFMLPSGGAFNLHASLLPRYRGAAPINWAIINGETQTGLTTFFLKRKVDTGDTILQREVEIGEEETFGELTLRLSHLGAELVLDTLKLLQRGEAKTTPQDERLATVAPKIEKEHCRIDWSKKAQEVKNLIRGLSPEPGAYTHFRGKALKLYRSQLRGDLDLRGQPGEVLLSSPKEGMAIACGEASLWLQELQLEGKKAITGQEFVRGYRVEVGEVLR